MQGIDNLKGSGGGGSSTLSGLTDVNLSGVADGDNLEYDSNSNKWVNVPCLFAVVNGELCQVYDDGN